MASVIERFQHHFDRAAQVLASAPGRVNLIGEHTDYNGGLALPIALPQRAVVAMAPRTDDRLRMVSTQFMASDPEQGGDPGHQGLVEIDFADVSAGVPDGWAAYAAGVMWALRDGGYAVSGVDLLIDGRVPVGAGLSSSAAIECAVGSGASAAFELGLLEDADTRAHLAALCQRAENEIAQAPTGGMDQAASMLCEQGYALRLDCRDGTTSQVPIDLSGQDVSLLVIDTRASHALGDGQYGARRAQCEEAAEILGVSTLREVLDQPQRAVLDALPTPEMRRRVRHVLTEIARVDAVVAALQDNDFHKVGTLFNQSHASLRDDYEVSSAELDLAVDASVAAGALGARMTGGGFGGSAIALVDADIAPAVTAAVTEAFAAADFAAPSIFAATPSPGASVDEPLPDFDSDGPA